MPVSKRRPSPQVGESYDSNNYGTFTIVSVEPDKTYTIRFDETGAIKTGAMSSAIFVGNVRDPSRPKELSLDKKFPIGSVWESNNWGRFSIISIQNARNVTVQFEDTGNVVDEVSTESIRRRHVVDRPERDRLRNYLSPKEGMHYVYIAKLDGEVIYVGKGFGKRYLHCRSGGSHNVELNRLFFSGEVVDVSIHKDGLTNKEAEDMEKTLITILQPYCNQKKYHVSF